MDWFGANEAFHNALELDPANARNRWNYAMFLEHDQNGRRYSPVADMAGAVAEYKRTIKEGVYAKSMEDLNYAMALALMYCENFSEAKQLLTESNKTPAMNTINVVITAIEQGPAAAREKAEQLEPQAEKRNSLINAASNILFEIRYYPQAKSLMETLPADMQNDLKSRIQVVGQAHRIDQSALSENSPLWPIEQLYLGVLADDRDDKHLSDLFINAGSEADVTAAIDRARRPLIPYIKLIYLNNISPRRMADMISLCQMSAKKGDDMSYQIVVSGLTGEKINWHVIFREGRFRIVAPGPHSANLGAIAMECLKINDNKKAEQWLDWAYDEHKKDVGWIDSFAGSPFGQIWWKNNHHDRQTIDIAAAALVCEGPFAHLATPILAEQRKKEPPASMALQIDRALAMGYLRSGNVQAALDTANKILSSYPDSQEAMNWKALALWASGRADELRGWLRIQLDTKNLTPKARETLALQASKIGDFDTALKHLRQLSEKGNASAMGLNELAWIAVIYDTADETALKYAVTAQKLAGDNQSAYLNTLAAVYAATGNANKALETLYLCVDARGGEPQDPDWCVLGRIAESYGLNEIAKSLYNKVSRPRQQTANDSFAFAQRRLAILELTSDNTSPQPLEKVDKQNNESASNSRGIIPPAHPSSLKPLRGKILD